MHAGWCRTLVVVCCLAVVAAVLPALPVSPAAAAPASVTASAATPAGKPSLMDRVKGLLGIGSKPAAGQDGGRPALSRQQAVPAGKPLPAPRRVRELVDKRAATQRVFALSDGRVQAEVSAAPLFYQDARGRWQPIDTHVRAASGRDGFAYANQANSFASWFGTRSERLVAFALGGGRVSVGLGGQGRALAPRVAGDTVTYPDALAGGADLAYQVTREALKERIVLDRPVADPTFTFGLRLEGVVARPAADGSIGFYPADGDGGLLFSMPKPFMTDATDDPASPYGKRFSDRVTQTIRQQGSRSRSPSTPTQRGSPARTASGRW